MSTALLTEIALGPLTLRNRIVKSAIYEGAAGSNGIPNKAYMAMYKRWAKTSVGLLITGFVYSSRSGRAMQPFQAGIETDAHILGFRDITQAVHDYGTPVAMQLAHTGRQSRSTDTGSRLVSSTSRASVYFREKPRLLSPNEVRNIEEDLAVAAARAQEAGFDCIQLHAAHGYLIHQFLHPQINRLNNEYGIDCRTGLGTLFLEETIHRIRTRCGEKFPILVKISGDTDMGDGFFPSRFDHLIAFLDRMNVSAIEISYGTMDYPMNIFRGDIPLTLAKRNNPFLQSRASVIRFLKHQYFRTRILPMFIPFTPAYNLHYAERAKTLTNIPIISVGGFRKRSEMEAAIRNCKADLVALARPFLREPELANILSATDNDYVFKCTNCNHCVMFCDTRCVTTCYQKHH